SNPLAEPAAQLAVGLMRQPQPGEFDCGGSRAMVAGFADALLSPAGAAVIGSVGQSEATADLTPVLEVTVEDLIGQKLGDLRANRLELGKLDRLRLYRVLGRCAMHGRIRRLERLDLLVHQDQPLMLAT